MAEPFALPNETQGELTSEFVHGTDDHLHLVAIGEFDSGGGRIRVRTVDNTHWALYMYTGVSTNDLTGLTQSGLGGVVETDAAYTFPAGAIVERALMGEDVACRIMGPASAVDERILVADGTSGKKAKDGGATIAELALLAGRSGGQTLIGGTAATDDLILRATSGVGASGSDIILQVGNNGATEAMRILYGGKVGIGTASPASLLTLSSTAPTFRMVDTTASAKSLLLAVDANFAHFYEAAGAAGSLLTLDLANNWLGVGTAAPSYQVDVLKDAADAVLSVRTTTSNSAILRLTAAGAANAHSDLRFYDAAALGVRFVAAFGNSAGSRYGGFHLGLDRDGGTLPFKIFTADAGGDQRLAVHVVSGQTAGLCAGTAIGGGTTAPTAGLTVADCLGVGGMSVFGTSAAKVLGIANGTAPSSSPADAVQLWSADVNAAAGYSWLHGRDEKGHTLIVAGVVIKTDTGNVANPHEGIIEINTFDNKVYIYADAGWRQLATW